jgi:hypothetical protein
MSSPQLFETLFSEEYKEQCFATWFANGCPVLPKLYRLMENDPYSHKKPSLETLTNWFYKGDWKSRAETLKQAAIEKLDQELITKRTEMMKRIAEDAKDVQLMALQYLKETGFDSSASAVQAWARAAALEKETLGADITLSRVAAMSNQEVSKKLTSMLNKKLGLSEVVDGDAVDIEEENAVSDTEDTN